MQQAQEAFENFPVGVYQTAVDGRIIAANPAVLRILGLPPGTPLEVAAQAYYADPQERVRWRERIDRGGDTQEILLTIRRPDGSLRYVKDSAHALRDATGAVVGYQGIWEDVTERRLADAARAEADERFRLIISQIPAVVWTTDRELVYTSAFGSGLSSLGLEPRDLVGQRLTAIFEIDDDDHPQIATCRRVLDGWPGRYESVLRGRHFRTLVQPQRDVEGTIVGVIGVAVDITEQRFANAALARSEAQLAEAQRYAHLGSWETDVRSGATVASEELFRIYGLEPRREAVSVHTFADLQHPVDARQMRHVLAKARSSRKPYAIDHRIRRPDGTHRWLQERGEYRYDETGEPVTCVGTCFDITERKLAEEQIVYRAQHDALTGLPNRTLLFERLERAFARCDRKGGGCAILFIDLNRFKYLNDTLGHLAGDRFLQLVASRLRASVSRSDTVARTGGDEFVILLPDLGDRHAVERVAERIVGSFADPFSLESIELYGSASIGIGLYPQDGGTAEQLLGSADSAMYDAKDSRSAYRFYEPRMSARAYEQLTLATDLRYALDRDEFRVHYQPIVGPDGTLHALEALVRWDHPTRGLIAPGVFIPVAEDTGTIVRLGELVVERACRQLAAWDAAGRPRVRIAVNLSGRQFQARGLATMLARTLATTGIAPERLELELTESVVMSGAETAIGTLRELKAIGVAISIDDFGTGYSSLSYLKKLPIDALKIDRSFIADVPADRDDCAVVTAIVALAHSLDLRVVAEGIETDAQRRFLLHLQCDELQGYLIGRPLPPEAIVFERPSTGRSSVLRRRQLVG